MLACQRDAWETYRRIEFDARVEGADGIGLTRLCLERAIAQIERATEAHMAGNRHLTTDALSKASGGIAALSQGVDKANPLRGPLLHLYDSAGSAVRAAITQFKPDVLKRVRDDLQDILGIL